MIKVNKIQYAYPQKWSGKNRPMVFWNFSLTLEENKIYGLLGKNGTGKSTLLYLLAGLNAAQKGKIFIDDDDVIMSFALATNAKYLLMDEPTNGLDIESKSLFRKVIAQNMTDDRTLLISTHQVHDVENIIDHILILGKDDKHQTKLLLDKSIAELSDTYVFEHRDDDQMGNVIYSEPSLQGTSIIAHRTPRGTETPVHIELLYNAVNNGKL